MKTIGLLGGMSWESTLTYYKIINETVKRELGGLHSAKIILNSVDFHEIEKCQAENNWDLAGELLSSSAKSLETAGADFIIICTNTMHKVAPKIESTVSVPLIHIADATADVLIEKNISKVALLGTKYTMTQDFYKQRLLDRGISVIVPQSQDVETVNSVIFNELCLGVISEDSKKQLLEIIDDLAAQGARGVVLGCTELGLLINEKDSRFSIFDTALIHAEKAAMLALE